MGRYLVAHDIGTSRDKATLFSVDGNIIKSETMSYDMHFFNTDRVEQNAEDWWNAFCCTTKKLLHGFSAKEVAAVAISGQMMGCLAVDPTGIPLFPVITAADGRAKKEINEIVEKYGFEKYYQTVGIRPSENYTLAKIVWLKNHYPSLYERTYKFLSSKDFINFKLTGVFATDPLDATYMHMYDCKRKKWAEDLLQIADVELEKLPDVIEPCAIIGKVHSLAALECGLVKDTPVVMASGDGNTATLGTGSIHVGDAYTNLGTSSWVSVLTDSYSFDEPSISKADFFGMWRDSGTMQAGGYSYNWIRKILLSDIDINNFEIINKLALESNAGANGVLFLPYLLGERTPYWDMNLKASFLGMSAHTNKSDLIRSVMEGVALHLGLILNIIRDKSYVSNINRMRVMGGGAKNALWRQILADIFDLPIEKMDHSDEGGALACAVMGGIGIKLYDNISVIDEFQHIESITDPINNNVEFYKELQKLFVESNETLKELNHKISSFQKKEI